MAVTTANHEGGDDQRNKPAATTQPLYVLAVVGAILIVAFTNKWITKEQPSETKLCASLSDPNTVGGYDATYFSGGYEFDENGEPYVGWSWPKKWFANKLDEKGWKPVEMQDCHSATLKILYADETRGDGRVFKKYCKSTSNDRPSMAFGFDHVNGEFQMKNRFIENVRAYEKSHGLVHSVVPLTFHMGQPSECKAFFAMPKVESMVWISKLVYSYRGEGVELISDFGAFRDQHGDCSVTDWRAPQVQQYAEPPLIDGKMWNFRVFLFVVSLRPLRVLRRLGEIQFCSEPYVRRHDINAEVRNRATNCNPIVGKKHPLFEKPGGVLYSELKKPMHFDFLAPRLGETRSQQFFEKMDQALATVARVMESVIDTTTAAPNHVVGHYALDGLFDENGFIKLIDFNVAPFYPGFKRDEDAEARIAVTAFQQYAMLNRTYYDVDACVNIFPDFAWVVRG